MYISFKHIHSYDCKLRQFVLIEVFKILKLQGLRLSLRGREAPGLTFRTELCRNISC